MKAMTSAGTLSTNSDVLPLNSNISAAQRSTCLYALHTNVLDSSYHQHEPAKMDSNLLLCIMTKNN